MLRFGVLSRRERASQTKVHDNTQKPVHPLLKSSNIFSLGHVLGGKCVLFFGSRSKQKDNFFEKEWSPLQSNGRLTLFNAFSRDQVMISQRSWEAIP